MSLKPTLETLDGLHEEVAKLYTKKGDKFVLDVEDSGLKSALDKERERANAAEKALKDREAAEAKAKADAEKAQLEAKGDYEKLKANLEAEKATLLKEKDAAVDGLKSYLLKAELTQAIAMHKGTPHLLKLVSDQFEAVLDPATGEHKVLVKGDPTKTPAQYIEGLKKDASYGAFFEGSGQSGSGAPPAGKPGSGAPPTDTHSKYVAGLKELKVSAQPKQE